MNQTIQNNYTIDYTPEIIVKIKKMIKEGFEELKLFVKSKINSTFNKYYELEEKLNNISDKLRNLNSFSNEFEYYCFVKGKILHIIYENCKNNSYGHCDFALELFNFFIEVWNEKIRLNNNNSKKQLEIYKQKQNNFKNRLHKYRREFYCNIYTFSNEFSEDEMYNIHSSLRE